MILFYPIESRLSNLFSKICPQAQRLTSIPRFTIMFIRIGCYSAILCFRQFRIRRERIHAFRKVHEPPGFDESKNDDFCVGNAFMHSARVMVLRRCLERENVDSFRRERIYPFRPRSGITAPNYLTKGQVIRISSRIHDKSIHKSGFADGMSKPIPYGVDGLFPVQRTADVHQPFGKSKSVPYAHDWLIS